MSQLKSIQDKLLTQASSMLQPEGHISEMLFPYVGVKENTGKLAKYGNSHLRVESTITGGRGAYRRVEAIARSQTSYSIEGHGLEGLVTKADYRNVLLPYKAEEDEMIGLTSQLLVEKEYSLATVLANTSTITQNTTLSGTSQFSDYNNSDPLSVFKTARAAVKDGCGRWADTAWMDSKVKSVLKFHPQLLDFLGFKDNRPGGLNDQELATALDVKRVLISDAVYNSAAENQTDALSAIWGKHLWFGVLPEKPQVRQVSAGYRLGIDGQAPRKVYKYAVNNPPESTGILVEDEYDFIISNVGAIYVAKSVIA
jgi:hypothetical protein